MVTCDFCGRTATPGADDRADHGDDRPAPAPLTWSTSVERGRRRHYCEHCARTHLRAMEGRLDSEWW